MLPDFLIRATIAGLGVAIIAAPLGCFVVWRRMAYFGEATAHAALLGIALSLAIEMPIFAGTLLAALLMAFTISTFRPWFSVGYLIRSICACRSRSWISRCIVSFRCSHRFNGLSIWRYTSCLNK